MSSEMSPEEVKLTRDNLGDTQEEFAERIGATARSVSRWEAGEPVSKGFIKAIESL